MLATLYAKALDADFDKPRLGDRWAKDIVERLDYDWTKTTITARTSPSVTTRSAHFDNWAGQFLDAHPRAVVLHLGCGLDSRFFRLAPGPGIEWFDVDYPDVAALRRRLFPTRDRYPLVDAPGAGDRRGPDHVSDRGRRRRAIAPHRRRLSVG
jgi:O-methyltransferase involved in polyketide biosynthesis